MKVLAIVPDFIEKPSGGLGEQYRYLYENLKDDVDFYTVGYPEDNKLSNYRSAKASVPLNHPALTTIYGQAIYFLEALKFKQDFDIIHAFDWSTFYTGYLCKEYFQKPLVCSVNLSLQELNKCNIYYCADPRTIDGANINQLQVYFEQLGLMSADKVIHVSNYYLNLDSFAPFKEKSIVIENGIDETKWIKKRDPKLPGKNKLKFCYIGRASSMKGLNVILNTPIPKDVDFYFVVSDKNAEDNILSKIKQKANNVNIFHIPGLYGQDKVDFLFSMDGVVMPSIHEPFGIVALEALISENLFISTGSGGIREIVEGVNWFKVESPSDLYESFKKIQSLTKEEIDIVKKLGKEKILRYTWKKASNSLLNLYKSLIKPN